MPPKKKQLKLDRAQLEEAAAERIDAVTAESLHPTKFVEIVSPDGKLRLFYNTSTLVRIGLEKGYFTQPPHFREPMKGDLIQLVEQLEGRKIIFENLNERRTALAAVDNTGLAEIEHHHVHFQQIVDEFYLLSPADVYVCPSCLSRWIDENPDWRRPVDPLDAVQELDDERLGQMVFRYARDFNKHLATHHYIADDSKDHTLRALLCKYFSDFNESHSSQLSLHWYWIMNARYNVVRYNRVVEVAGEAHRRGDVWRLCSFPDPEEAPVQLGSSRQGCITEDQFIVADGEGSDDGGAFGIPTYEESSDFEESSDESECVSTRDRKRQRLDSDDETSSSSSSSLSSSGSSDSSVQKGYIKSHPHTDRRTYVERAYVQREMEKIHRKESKDFSSTVRRTDWSKDSLQSSELPYDDSAWGDFINGGSAPSKPPQSQILLDDDD